MRSGAFQRLIGLFCLLFAAVPTLGAEPIIVSNMNGVRVAPLRNSGQKATVLIFITNDCPIANTCAPEIERIYRDYSPKHVAFYLVYVDASQSASSARSHHKDFRYTCPAVVDPEHRLVRLARAEVTPEAAVFGPDGRLLYHGRIDDRAVAFGQVRVQPTRRDLRLTLDLILQGKPILVTHAKAVGCTIADLSRKP